MTKRKPKPVEHASDSDCELPPNPAVLLDGEQIWFCMHEDTVDGCGRAWTPGYVDGVLTWVRAATRDGQQHDPFPLRHHAELLRVHGALHGTPHRKAGS